MRSTHHEATHVAPRLIRMGRKSRLDAELAQLLSDPDSIGHRTVKSRWGRTAQKRSPRVVRARTARRRLPSPIFLGLVLLTAAGATLAALAPFSSTLAGVGVFVFILAGWLVSVCLHEFAHAYVAHRGGDDSIEGADYLRLNPFKYVHPLLSIVLPLLWIAVGGIGLPGGAVMVHRHRLRSRAWASAVSAAGPLTNLLIAGIALASLQLLEPAPTVSGHTWALQAAIGWFAWLQVAVGVLNLLPIPALDGWGIIEPWVSPSAAHTADKIKPFGFFVLFALLWSRPIADAFSRVIDAIVDPLGDHGLILYVGSQMFRFWSWG
jgi:Zn-dependent protease